MYKVYIIENSKSKNKYVGLTRQTLSERFRKHLGDSRKGKNTSALYNAIRKYGKDSFSITLLEDNIPNDKVDEKEIYYIKKFDTYYNGYNCTLGGRRVKGVEHYCTNNTLYLFIHKDLKVFVGTVTQMVEKTGLKRHTLLKLTSNSKNLKSCKGWTINRYSAGYLDWYDKQKIIQSNKEKKNKTKNKTVMKKKQNKIYTLYHNKYGKVSETAEQFEKLYGIPKRKIYYIMSIKTCTVEGWRNSEKEIKYDKAGKNNPMFGKSQSNKAKKAVSEKNRNSADKTKRTWVHSSGIIEKDITCLMLRDKYPHLRITCLNAIAKKINVSKDRKKGKISIQKQHKGWRLLETNNKRTV